MGYIGVGGRSNHGVVTKYNAKERYLRYSYKNNEEDGIDARCTTSQRPSYRRAETAARLGGCRVGWRRRRRSLSE